MNDPARSTPSERFGPLDSPAPPLAPANPTFVSPYEGAPHEAMSAGMEGPTVREIMTSDVKTCRADRTLVSAAAAMQQGDCRFLPVVDDQGRPIAVITDGDICEVGTTDHRPLRDILVSEAMSREVFTCHPEDSVRHVLETMKRRRIRHLPVVDAENRLVGVVSLTDVVLCVEGGGQEIAESLRPRLAELLRVVAQKERGTRTVRFNPFRED
jgi:CBS domain-containing protein